MALWAQGGRACASHVAQKAAARWGPVTTFRFLRVIPPRLPHQTRKAPAGTKVAWHPHALLRPRWYWRGGRSSRSRGYQFQQANDFRRMLQGMDPSMVVKAIMAANSIVYFMWQTDDLRHLQWMRKHFAVSNYGLFSQGRIHTLLTANFSHESLMHFGFNMFNLYAMGIPISYMLGTPRFLSLFLGGGILGCGAHTLWNSRGRNRYIPVLGASGGVYAIIAYYILRNPRAQILLFGAVPMPAAAIGLAVIGYDVYSLLGSGRSDVANVSHLTGAAVGFAASRTWQI